MRGLKLKCLVLAVCLSFFLPLGAQNSPSLTARDYYKEVYAAGRLDRMAGGYACFQDDPKVDSFFTFGESEDLRHSMLADGTLGKLPEATQGLLQKDFVMVRGYNKGIPWRGQEYLQKDEGSWISDLRMLNEETPIRIRFSINAETLRYKYAVEVLNMDSTYRTEVASFGGCEEVPAAVRQHAEE
jgi:hypothetical protein